MNTDYRTKPASEWTYYVVDHLPTMNTLYRFDTVEEAIAKFKELPSTSISAIGSSIHSAHEIDHIHRRNGQAVLLTDCDRTSSSIWRDSQEIQSAIDRMISELNVLYELSSDVFGLQYPSVAIPLERSRERVLGRYFADKILHSTNTDRPLHAVNEVFVAGNGWLTCEDFLNRLAGCRPNPDGKGAKTLFIDQLNIQYINQSGYSGQADLTPLEFCLLKDKSKRYVPVYSSAHAKSLSDIIQEADSHCNQNQHASQPHLKRSEPDHFHL